MVGRDGLFCRAILTASAALLEDTLESVAPQSEIEIAGLNVHVLGLPVSARHRH